MDTVNVYGIPNCNSVKKAIDWLKKNKTEFVFHDFKKSGITKQQLTVWCKKAGWQTVLNKKGTTWRGLTAQEQEGVTSQSSAVAIMGEKTSLIKRPVVEYKDILLIGFDEQKFTEVFG